MMQILHHQESAKRDYDCAVMRKAYLITLTLSFCPHREGLDKTEFGLVLGSGPEDVLLISGPDL